MGLLATYLILLVHMMDTSIANVALVSITTDLGVDAYDGQWVITSFGIGMAAALPFIPKVVEWLGHATALTAALLLSLASLATCGLAESLLALALSRFVQGVASGAVALLLQRLLLKHAGPEHRAFGLALWSSALFIAPAIGPFIGASAISLLTWRWLFIGQLPLLLAASAFLLEEFSWKTAVSEARPNLLLAVLFTTVMLCVEVGLDSALNPDIRDKTRVLVCLVAGVTAAFLLTRVEKARTGLFDWSLLQNGVYRTYTIQSALLGSVTLATSLIYTLWLQLQLDLSVLDVARILAGSSIIAGISSPLIGRIKQKQLYPYMIGVGLLFLMASFMLCIGLNPQGASSFDLVLPRLLMGLGTALCSPAGYLAVAALSNERVLPANSLGLFTRTLSGTLFVLLSSEAARQAQLLFSEQALSKGFGTQTIGVPGAPSPRLLSLLLSRSTGTEAMHLIYEFGLAILVLLLLNLLIQNARGLRQKPAVYAS